MAWVAGDILDCSAEAHRIEPYQVDAEMERVRRAFAEVEAELEESARRVSEQIDPSLGEIFRAHRLMLESLLESHEFEKELRESLASAAEAVKTVFRKWEAKLAAIQDETLRERADDIVDLARRVLRQLEGADAFGLAAMPAGSVLITQRLLPSDVVGLSPRDVKAIVVESLGQGSHAALITREKGIPTLAGLPGLLRQIHSGDEALVDAFREALIIWPSPDARRDFDHSKSIAPACSSVRGSATKLPSRATVRRYLSKRTLPHTRASKASSRMALTVWVCSALRSFTSRVSYRPRKKSFSANCNASSGLYATNP